MNEKIESEKELYRKGLIEMISRIESIGTLEYLHRFIELFLEKWG